jgi:hypothetical protein
MARKASKHAFCGVLQTKGLLYCLQLVQHGGLSWSTRRQFLSLSLACLLVVPVCETWQYFTFMIPVDDAALFSTSYARTITHIFCVFDSVESIFSSARL